MQVTYSNESDKTLLSSRDYGTDVLSHSFSDGIYQTI